MDGFIRENPIRMDDLGVPLFLETSIKEGTGGENEDESRTLDKAVVCSC